MRYKAICFDIDGTLYPRAVMNRRLFALGLCHPIFSVRYNKMRKELRKCQDSLQGNLMSKEANMMLKNSGISTIQDIERTKQHLENWIYKPMEKLYKNTKPFDGVVETFKAIKDRDLKIGVFSDFPLFKKLESMGLSSYVDFAASSDDVGFLKPSIHCFEYLLYNIGLDAKDVLYVGDSYDKDVVGAHNARLDAVLVNAKGSVEEYPLACEVFESWGGFDRWLLKEVFAETSKRF